MKKLVAAGRVLIIAQPKFRLHGRFVPWPTKGGGAMIINGMGVSSAHLAPSFDSNLKSGERFIYCAPGFLNAEQNVSFYQQRSVWVSANGRVGYTGEWFNGSFRGRIIHKFTVSEFLAYAHYP